ncbi:MAG: hypothetical protein HQ510_00370 [Candidatus Marinimicrobia bacterium]|nr:hypothetical protein [Candidatus Neomarinimicrobiota bacterium]
MKTFSLRDLEAAISGVCNRLGIEVDTALQQEYQNGKHPQLLSYEKVEISTQQIPTIQKYLIGAQTILNQPSHFYDIFRACRHFFFIQILDHAIETVIEKVANYEGKIEKLLRETTFDPFDAILYELTVAANYANSPGVSNVLFLDESTIKTPDLELVFKNEQIFVECKKFDRSASIVSQIRNEIRDKTQLTLHSFHKQNQSAIIEVSFHKNPNLISNEMIRDICLEAYKTGKAIIDKSLTAIAKPLPYKKLDDYVLFPSPMYYWSRYGFQNKGEWFGITSLMNAKFGRHVDVVDEDAIASSWLDDIDYECVLKWKITDDNIIWRYKRLGYNLLFKGLSQLQVHGINSVLHAWYERDDFVGHRKNELVDFFSRLSRDQRDIFSWIIFNETILDTSVGGRFDLIELSHPISGPTAKYQEPILTNVFTREHNYHHEYGEFGIGPELPDIDEVYREII